MYIIKFSVHTAQLQLIANIKSHAHCPSKAFNTFFNSICKQRDKYVTLLYLKLADCIIFLSAKLACDWTVSAEVIEGDF